MQKLNFDRVYCTMIDQTINPNVCNVHICETAAIYKPMMPLVDLADLTRPTKKPSARLPIHGCPKRKLRQTIREPQVTRQSINDLSISPLRASLAATIKIGDKVLTIPELLASCIVPSTLRIVLRDNGNCVLYNNIVVNRRCTRCKCIEDIIYLQRDRITIMHKLECKLSVIDAYETAARYADQELRAIAEMKTLQPCSTCYLVDRAVLHVVYEMDLL